jgi:hypothetical protein
MSRKFNRALAVRRVAKGIIEDPRTILGLFRPKPRYLPWFVWARILLFVTKRTHHDE